MCVLTELVGRWWISNKKNSVFNFMCAATIWCPVLNENTERYVFSVGNMRRQADTTTNLLKNCACCSRSGSKGPLHWCVEGEGKELPRLKWRVQLQNREASCGEQLPLDYRVARARNLMGVQGVDRWSGSWDLHENWKWSCDSFFCYWCGWFRVFSAGKPWIRQNLTWFKTLQYALLQNKAGGDTWYKKNVE